MTWLGGGRYRMPLDRAPHVEDNLAGNFPVPHLEDVYQPHFNLAAERKMPVPILCHLKRDDAIIHHTIFGSEPLKELELHVTHGRKEFPVILGSSFLAGEGSMQAIGGRCFSNDIVGECLECRFDFIACFAVEVVLHSRKILGYAIFVHVCLLSDSGHGL